MHRIRLITIGRIKTPWITDGIDVFAGRLRLLCNFESTVIDAGKPEQEAKRLRAALEKSGERYIVLDERGKQQTSVQFAQWFQRKRDSGQSLTFVIGGAYGIPEDIRNNAGGLIALSAMTFPHELAQLIFLEQLYRAHAINAGTGYHH